MKIPYEKAKHMKVRAIKPTIWGQIRERLIPRGRVDGMAPSNCCM
jgi:tRNA G46 methylase TrmB